MHLIGLHMIQSPSKNVKKINFNFINAKSTADGLQNELSCKENKLQSGWKTQGTEPQTHSKIPSPTFSLNKSKTNFQKNAWTYVSDFIGYNSTWIREINSSLDSLVVSYLSTHDISILVTPIHNSHFNAHISFWSVRV